MAGRIPVILVDDEPTDRYIMSRRLRESDIDCEVYEFEAGDRFLEVFTEPTSYQALVGAEAPPAIVCLDINMPRLSGFDVLNEIATRRAAGEALPDSFILVMVTSSTNEEDCNRALENDIVLDFMPKPLDIDKLKSLLDAHYPGR